MRINYNVQAMNANLALNKADARVSKTIGRLSSGLKISAAKDEPSGYAISKRMNLQIEGLSRATQSSNDAINIISIADGALQEVTDMVTRMSELAVKGATDTITDDDRTLIQQEIAQLKKEIQRVADTTEFNGQTLLDGSFDLKGYTDDPNLSVKVATYSDETPAGKYALPSGISLVWNGSQLDAAATITANDPPAVTFPAPYPANTKVSAVDGTLLTITGDGDFSITLDVEGLNGAGSIPAMNMDITGIGAMDMQIGANEDQIIGIRIPALSLKLMSIDDADASTQPGAAKLIEDAKTALTYVNDLRSRLGAYQNRLEHTVETLGVTSEALTSAYSGLVDADMAEEAVEYSTAQILTEAATSVLAQANDRPSSALQLLQ
ncbi:MAG: flagellin [Lachnospiraceae bacterium]|nr:flagellin [Lachnospiraceae bacterium]